MSNRVWALYLILMGGIMLFFSQYSDVVLLRIGGAIFGIITLAIGCGKVIETVLSDRPD